MPTLPGANLPNTPALPGAVGTPQPTADEKAALEAKWAALRDAPPALAELILLVNAHPELLTWARASVAGTVQLVPH